MQRWGDEQYWCGLTGFEQVVAYPTATYYLVIHCFMSRVVIFNQNWNYINNTDLLANSYTMKYIGGYFYITSDTIFYKTDMNFVVLASSTNPEYDVYRQIYYDSSSSKFYVGTYHSKYISIFDTSCSLIDTISLAVYNYETFGINYFNGYFYVGVVNSNKIIKLLINGTITSEYETICLSSYLQIASITIDSFGYLAVTCNADGKILLLDYNLNYLNQYLITSNGPHVTSIDSYGRFVIMTGDGLEIYY
jgi:hypothetical protein